ncbi:MAG: hypothetical protein KatS3mg125_0050 [Lysobacterales bacterium]|jgi:hypothetical protein|nr:MAG: hypothetical protein KatS3mg125_0050 [Xanthomonadales bacterium]
MGLLDELEREAKLRQSEPAAASADREAREKAFRESCEPAVDRIAGFLRKLFAHVEQLGLRTKVVFELPGYGEIHAETEPLFQLRPQREPGLYRLEIAGTLQILSEECALKHVEGAAKVGAMMRLFQQHRLAGAQVLKKDEHGQASEAVFRPRGKIDLRAEIEASATTGQIRFRLMNFEGFTTIQRMVSGDRVNDAFLDEFGNYLLCRSRSLFQESLPEQLRHQLRAKVQREALKKACHERILERQRVEYPALARNQGPLAQVRWEIRALGRRLLRSIRRKKS